MRPPRLRAGDTMAVVAPAGPVPADLLEKAMPVLRGWGVELRIGPCVRAEPGSPPYLSGSDAARAAEFTEAWLDPGVRCVLAARGGYGVQRMLDLVDWAALREAGPKVLAGSSDITALHRAVDVHLGLSSLFSPMPASVLFDDFAVRAPAADAVRPRAEPGGARRFGVGAGPGFGGADGREPVAAGGGDSGRRSRVRRGTRWCCWRTSRRACTGWTGC